MRDHYEDKFTDDLGELNTFLSSAKLFKQHNFLTSY